MTVALTIGGREHVGWTEATVTRSLDTISGAFTVSLSERDPGETRPRFIRPGDDCRVSLEGDTVISRLGGCRHGGLQRDQPHDCRQGP